MIPPSRKSSAPELFSNFCRGTSSQILSARSRWVSMFPVASARWTARLLQKRAPHACCPPISRGRTVHCQSRQHCEHLHGLKSREGVLWFANVPEPAQKVPELNTPDRRCCLRACRRPSAGPLVSRLFRACSMYDPDCERCPAHTCPNGWSSDPKSEYRVRESMSLLPPNGNAQS